MNLRFAIVPLFFLTILFSTNAQGAEADPARPILRIGKVLDAPVIDGFLDDGVWERDPVTMTAWISYDPIRREPMANRTEVWVSHDDEHLYFAFRCHDPEPDKIRTTISRRDNVFGDDWVGLSLDSFGTGQTSYHLMVNPSGVQMDALNSTASMEQFATDFVWDSAGQITESGYDADFRIPLQTIRFSGGDEVEMGVLFWRRISRMGQSWAWPELLPGQWVFDSHASLVFDNLEQPQLLEVIPSATYSLNQSQIRPGEWSPANSDPNAGISLKYGITSTITLESTFNPDFSQVESDAFQNQVNNRFSVFFDEKRPFFMEGSSLFSVAGSGGDSNMRTAVHTRRIIDPNIGLKLTGTTGKMIFGFLSAADEAPDRVIEDVPNEYAGKRKVFNIGRAMYNFGPSSYVGGLVTDTRFASGHNQVVGGDAVFRLDGRQKVTATFLDSDTLSPDGKVASSGRSAQATYNFDTLRFRTFAQVEHFDEDFQMDTAFINRTGVTGVKSFTAVNFYPETGGWLKKISPGLWIQRTEDRVHDGVETAVQMNWNMNFSRQGYFGGNVRRGREPWLGTTYNRNQANLWGGAQFTKWLNVNGWLNAGKSILYDPVDAFQGDSFSGNVNVTLQPTDKLNQNVSYTNVRFDREATGERIFTVHIVNTKTRYQFSRFFFVRSLIQFDSSQKRVLTDLLASYQLVPGTVVHLGYGSLIERRDFRDGRWVPGEGDYLTTSRGVFFKASYLYRF
jgi:hypothetical protein